MLTKDRHVQLYENLAYAHERCDDGRRRDWFLVLAADAAHDAGWSEEAERLHGQLLHANPNHLARSFRTFDDAMRSPDMQSYVADLKRSYPPDSAEQLLAQMRNQTFAALDDGEESLHEEEYGSSAEISLTSDHDVFGDEWTEPEMLPDLHPFLEAREKVSTMPEPAFAPQPEQEPEPPEQEWSPPPAPPIKEPRNARAAPRKPKPIFRDWDAVSPSRAAPAPMYNDDGEEDYEEDNSPASWLVNVIVFLVFLAGIALLAYAVARPLLEAEGVL